MDIIFDGIVAVYIVQEHHHNSCSWHINWLTKPLKTPFCRIICHNHRYCHMGGLHITWFDINNMKIISPPIAGEIKSVQYSHSLVWIIERSVTHIPFSQQHHPISSYFMLTPPTLVHDEVICEQPLSISMRLSFCTREFLKSFNKLTIYFSVIFSSRIIIIIWIRLVSHF